SRNIDRYTGDRLHPVPSSDVSGPQSLSPVNSGGSMILHLLAVSVKDTPVVHAGKAIALALGIGLGAAGAGAGIGNIFGSMIQSVARQPELRGELQGLMWLGFALTEAVVFYGFLGGLLGYVFV